MKGFDCNSGNKSPVLSRCGDLETFIDTVHCYSKRALSEDLNILVRECDEKSVNLDRDINFTAIELLSDCATDGAVNDNISKEGEGVGKRVSGAGEIGGGENGVTESQKRNADNPVHKQILTDNSNSTGLRRRFVDTSITSIAKVKKRKFFCQVDNCKSSFLHLANYTSHMRSHELASSKCQMCAKVFADVDELQIHQAETHHVQSKTTYPCSHCDKRFSCEAYRDRHLRRALKSCNLVCVVCTKIFHDQSDLNVHMKNIHSADDRQFSCKECGMKFKRETHAISHMKKHFPTDSHICEICSKEFNESFHLLRHKKVHSENKYFCTVCGAGFTYQRSLVKHANQQHPKHQAAKTRKGDKYGKRMYEYRLREVY